MPFDNDPDRLTDFIQTHPMVLVYFSTPTCNVCKALRPKVEALIAEEFPRVDFVYIDTTEEPAVSGQLSVFAVPTLALFTDGRESRRFNRAVSLHDLREAVTRPYGIIFDEEAP